MSFSKASGEALMGLCSTGFPAVSRIQTYNERACRSIPQVYSYKISYEPPLFINDATVHHVDGRSCLPSPSKGGGSMSIKSLHRTLYCLLCGLLPQLARQSIRAIERRRYVLKKPIDIVIICDNLF